MKKPPKNPFPKKSSEFIYLLEFPSSENFTENNAKRLKSEPKQIISVLMHALNNEIETDSALTALYRNLRLYNKLFEEEIKILRKLARHLTQESHSREFQKRLINELFDDKQHIPTNAVVQQAKNTTNRLFDNSKTQDHSISRHDIRITDPRITKKEIKSLFLYRDSKWKIVTRQGEVIRKFNSRLEAERWWREICSARNIAEQPLKEWANLFNYDILDTNSSSPTRKSKVNKRFPARSTEKTGEFSWSEGKGLCPRCGGDGGATGQCFKCGGTGWA